MIEQQEHAEQVYTVQLTAPRDYSIATHRQPPPEGSFSGPLSACVAYICDTSADSARISSTFPLAANLTAFLPHLPREYWMIKDFYFEAQHDLDAELMRQAVDLIATYHDALRLRMIRDDQHGFQPHTSDAGWIAGLVEPAEPPFLHIDLSNIPASEHHAWIEMLVARQKSVFHVSTGPIARCICFTLGDGRPARLRVLVHHLAVDTYAQRVLLKDLQNIYQQLCKGEAIALPPKHTAYKTWAEYMHTQVVSAESLAGLGYWQSLPWADLKPLPGDYPRGMITDASLKDVSVALTQHDTLALLRNVLPFYQAQLMDVVIAALALALAQWSGQELLLFAVMSHGRDLPGIHVMRTVGCMSSSNRLLLQIDPSASPTETVRLVRDQRLGMPHQGKIESWTSAIHWDRLPDALCSSKPHAQFNFLGQHQSSPHPRAELLQRLPTPMVEKDDRLERVPWADFDCKAIIMDGQFSTQWEYSDLRYKQSTVEALAGRYIHMLQSIINAATGASETAVL